MTSTALRDEAGCHLLDLWLRPRPIAAQQILTTGKAEIDHAVGHQGAGLSPPSNAFSAHLTTAPVCPASLV